MVSRSPFRAVGLAALALVAAVAAPASATAADFAWRGHAPPGDSAWSNSANWQGGVPPSGSVGTLTFPKLGGGCSVTQSPKSCYETDNDLSGISAHAISLENSQGYGLFGNAITLGAGGLNAAPVTSQCPCGFTIVALPIVLGADQTWSIEGVTLAMDAKVTGQTHGLHINLGSNMNLNLADVEAGPVTITGSAPDVFAIPFVVIEQRSGAGELNGVDRQPVQVSKIYLRASHAAVGPLTLTNAVVSGTGGAKPGKLQVNGAVKLDSRSEVITYVTNSGESAGKDYWQLAARGRVNLGKASLIIDASTSKGFGANQPCPKPKRGTVETLIKSKGSVKGRFAHIHDKGKVQIECVGKRPTLRIHYKKHSVTAKVV